MSIHIDPKFGHVRVLNDRDALVATIVDHCDRGQVETYGDLTPTEAIDVGRALIKWAGNVRKRRGVES